MNPVSMIDRPRRLRKNELIRALVRETTLAPAQLVYPLFVCEGEGVRREVESMPGCFNLSIDELVREIDGAKKAGLSSFILFGVPDHKDPKGSDAYAEDGIVQRALRAAKREVNDITLIADNCLCEYTDHGHCGIVDRGEVLNDPSLDLLAREAVAQAEAGADIIAPSSMMDGVVGAIRRALDSRGFEQVPILSYAIKYASAFYGPFREAAGSTPQFGDRRGYQMDPANVREAMREAALDLEQGADILMVKPALAYLDVIRVAKERFDAPLGAYQVSGEYAMIKAAALKGWIDEDRIVLETLLAIRRAGADLILTYFAKQAIRLIG